MNKLSIKHRATGDHASDELFKDIKLEFSVRSESHQSTLDPRQKSRTEVVLPSPVVTTFVKITATGVYSGINNGFSDILCSMTYKETIKR